MKSTAHAPYSVETEQAVLGLCLTDHAKLEVAAGRLKADSFHDPLHQRVWATYLRLMQSGAGGVSVVTVHEAMKTDPGILTLEAKMGSTRAYFDALAESAPIIGRIGPMLDLLCDLADRRKLDAIGQSLTDGANTSPEESPTTGLAAAALEALLTVGADISKPAVRPYDVAGRVLAKAEAALKGEKPPSITTGLKKLDKAIGGGLQATDFMGVAGRSGMGKSALLRSIGLSAAMAGNPTLFFSTEMSADQLTQLMLTDLAFRHKGRDDAKIETWKFRAGYLTEWEIRRLREARELLDGLPFEICDDADLTMGSVRTRTRAFQSRHRDRLILVETDFLQNITDELRGHTDNRENSVNRLAYGHKKMAKALDCAVAAAIQLKNKSDGKSPRDVLPTADDIRESGSIEMACDLLFAPHRPAFFHQFKEPAVPHDRPEWVSWNEKMDEIRNDLWLRGFKNRHGNPCSLNLELWASLDVGTILDERPNRWRLGDPAEDVPAEELQF